MTALDKAIKGIDSHYHMICSSCPYHKDADDVSNEYCGRDELFKDVMDFLEILKKMKEVRDKYRRMENESVGGL